MLRVISIAWASGALVTAALTILCGVALLVRNTIHAVHRWLVGQESLAALAPAAGWWLPMCTATVWFAGCNALATAVTFMTGFSSVVLLSAAVHVAMPTGGPVQWGLQYAVTTAVFTISCFGNNMLHLNFNAFVTAGLLGCITIGLSSAALVLLLTRIAQHTAVSATYPRVQLWLRRGCRLGAFTTVFGTLCTALLLVCWRVYDVSKYHSFHSVHNTAHDWLTMAAQYFSSHLPVFAFTPDNGWIKGQLSRDLKFSRFQGVPFAQPAQRWRQPTGLDPVHEKGASEWPEESVSFDSSHRLCLWDYLFNWLSLLGLPGSAAPLKACYQPLLGKLGQEDCLVLDIYSRAPTQIEPHRARMAPEPDKLDPVLVFFFGGAFLLGDKFEAGLYDAKALSSGTNASGSPLCSDPRCSLVVVNVNYRLGPLGFLAHEALQAEHPEGSTGNYGLMDQREALRWIQRNIKYFGGDPSRVNIFGESAGAISVCCHLASPQSLPLFHGAIMQSTNCDGPLVMQPLSRALEDGEEYLRTLCQVYCKRDCNNPVAQLECARGLDTDQTVIGPVGNPRPFFKPAGAGTWDKLKFFYDYFTEPTASAEPILAIRVANVFVNALDYFFSKSVVSFEPMPPRLPWVPTIDATTAGLLERPLDRLHLATGKKVIIGYNKDEGSIFVPTLFAFVANITRDLSASGDEPRRVARAFLCHHRSPIDQSTCADAADKIWQVYSSDTSREIVSSMAELMKDFVFACPTIRAAQALAAGNVSTFVFNFNYENVISIPIMGEVGVLHMAELFFLFDGFDALGIQLDETDREVQAILKTAWGDLARSPARQLNQGAHSHSNTCSGNSAGSSMHVLDDEWIQFGHTNGSVLVIHPPEPRDHCVGVEDSDVDGCVASSSVISTTPAADLSQKHHCDLFLNV